MTKTTKRALLASVLSLILCVSLLVGSTFAWFTDKASTGVNNIVSGNLDIDLVDEEGKTLVGKTLQFKKAAGAEGETVLWEPGCTYELPQVFVKNKGNLWVKYQISITGIDGDAKLNEAIEWTVALDGNAITESTLAPGATSGALTIKGHMKEDAGNEYQSLSIEGISITVFATQYNMENDSFGPDYDVNAPQLVSVNGIEYATLNEAISAAQDGDVIKVQGVHTLSGSFANGKALTVSGIDGAAVIEMPASVAATGYDLTFDGVTFVTPDVHNGSFKVGIQHVNSTTFKNSTLYGNITMYGETAVFEKCEFVNYKDYNVWTYGVDTTFTECTFTTGGKAVLVYNDGAVTSAIKVDQCVFNSNGKLATDKAAIEIGDNAGTPASNHTVTITDTVANGFATNNSTSSLWGNKNNMPKERLTVTVDGVAQVVDRNDRFANALAAANYGETVVLTASAEANYNKYKLYGNVTTKGTVVVEEGNSIEIDLNGYTLAADDGAEMNAPLLLNKGNLTVKNGTLKNELASANVDAQRSLTAIRNESGVLTLNDVAVYKYGPTNGQYGIVVTGGKVVMNNSTLESTRGGFGISGTGAVEMTGGSITQTTTSKSGFYCVFASGTGVSEFNGVELIQKRSGRDHYSVVAGTNATFVNCTEK